MVDHAPFILFHVNIKSSVQTNGIKLVNKFKAVRPGNDVQQIGWHSAQIVLELIANAVAFVALWWALSGHVPLEPGGVTLAPFVLLVFLTLGLIPQIADIYRAKNFASANFVLIRFVAHSGLVYALTCGPNYSSLLLLVAWRPNLPWHLLPIFCTTMLFVWLIDLYFLSTQDSHMNKRRQSMGIRLILFSVVGYTIVLLLSLHILSDSIL